VVYDTTAAKDFTDIHNRDDEGKGVAHEVNSPKIQ